ncbi:hypothetical protein BH10PSE13_BH10PSE13_05650 [soil metagenome]
MTNEDSADVNAIRRLIAQYVITGDQAEMAVDEIFTDDARVEIPGVIFRGKEEVRAFYDSRKEAGRQDIANNRRARHQLTTMGIDITGPTSGTGTTYFLLVRLGRITQMGTYFDQYRKVDGRWLIADRDVVLHYMVDA